MADATPYFVVRTFVTPISFPGVPIVIPFDCSRVVIENPDAENGAQFRSDNDNPNSMKVIPAAAELDIRGSDVCFRAGTVVGYVATPDGASEVVVTFTL